MAGPDTARQGEDQKLQAASETQGVHGSIIFVPPQQRDIKTGRGVYSTRSEEEAPVSGQELGNGRERVAPVAPDASESGQPHALASHK